MSRRIAARHAVDDVGLTCGGALTVFGVRGADSRSTPLRSSRALRASRASPRAHPPFGRPPLRVHVERTRACCVCCVCFACDRCCLGPSSVAASAQTPLLPRPTLATLTVCHTTAGSALHRTGSAPHRTAPHRAAPHRRYDIKFGAEFEPLGSIGPESNEVVQVQ